jgi:drug/metabolite transporter superfamily protein YnfA
MGISMFSKFIAVVVFSPVFLLPSAGAFVIGAGFGQIYIKAQLSVKRELSNARSPVLSHFGAAIAGIGTCVLRARRENQLTGCHSFHPCLLSPEFIPARVVASY